MTEKIIISKNLNEWLKKHPTLNNDNTIYSKRFGYEIFQELIDKVWVKTCDTKRYKEMLAVFGVNGNSKVAHLWLLLNRDKWEVEEDKLFYIFIPERDGSNAYLRKDYGLEFNSNLPVSECYKWTQEEIDNHNVAKHLQHFKREVEK